MLDRDQAAIAATLLLGPDHLPAGLFAGGEAAVLRGLRVHANTISHARLVALEDTFPRTRQYLGDAAFNHASRLFVETGGAGSQSLSDIGSHFPGWLADPLAADLARVEWAWLKSYHAADAPALRLADLAGYEADALLGLPVRLHPAARVVTLTSDAAPLVDPAFESGTAAVIVTRPEAEVQLYMLVPAANAALDLATQISPLGNLIALLAEMHPDGGVAIGPLIDAGAFEKV